MNSGSTDLNWEAFSKAWIPIAAMSLAAVGGQLLFTHGYAYTSLSTGTMLAMMVPFLATLGGRLIFGEALTPHFVAGTGLILMSVGILGWRERVDLDFSIFVFWGLDESRPRRENLAVLC